jgi:hypothetical protein
MSENEFKHELLKQNGKTAVDREVSHLHAIIDAERRRVRRLTWLTIGVWVIWFLMISLALVMPMIAYQAARASGPPAMTQPAVAQPALAQPAARHEPSAASVVIAGIFGVVLFVAVLGLPVAGIVLAIMLIVSRRTASMNQVRASLAAIDAQLRVLGATGAAMRQDETR